MADIIYSIIIPVKAINDYVRETVTHVQKLTQENWELFILPNEKDPNEWHDPRITIVASGRVGPADKRDQGARLARGEILVFLDDDSYPSPDLLEVAERSFQDPEVAAIGGPGITPPHDTFWQKVSGAVFLSKVGGGKPERYIPLGKIRSVTDWPSVNLMVRKKEFLEVGGFNSKFWPGEDTKFCFDLIKKTNKKILYIPELIVWHHRREGLWNHMKQVGNYGFHRGYFAKKYPKTTLKLFHLTPPLFFWFVVFSLFFMFYPPWLQQIILVGWGLYGLALLKAFLDFMKYEKNILIALLALFYTFMTHLSYGGRFWQGLFLTRGNLVSKLR